MAAEHKMRIVDECQNNNTRRSTFLKLLRTISSRMTLGRHLVGENALSVPARSLSPPEVAHQSVIYAGEVSVVSIFLISAWFLCEGEQFLRRCAWMAGFLSASYSSTALDSSRSHGARQASPRSRAVRGRRRGAGPPRAEASRRTCISGRFP